LYRIAAEKATLGAIFHAIGEEGIPFKDIAAEVRKQLKTFIIWISPEKVGERFDWFRLVPWGIT
jgi:hypothetical protein